MFSHYDPVAVSSWAFLPSGQESLPRGPSLLSHLINLEPTINAISIHPVTSPCTSIRPGYPNLIQIIGGYTWLTSFCKAAIADETTQAQQFGRMR